MRGATGVLVKKVELNRYGRKVTGKRHKKADRNKLQRRYVFIATLIRLQVADIYHQC